MHLSVQTQFRRFNEPFEGVVAHMYLDIKGLVTVGVGNLIDPVDCATPLPFRFKNKPTIVTPGEPASKAQIAAEWHRLKNNRPLAQAGHCACEPVTSLELDEHTLNSLIEQRLADNENWLRRQPAFQQFDLWPADAQLGLLSMAWALGPAGALKFHKFCASCEKLDFVAAASQCRMNEAGNPGVIPRNRANTALFSNAAVVLTGGLEASTLYYPRMLKTAA